MLNVSYYLVTLPGVVMAGSTRTSDFNSLLILLGVASHQFLIYILKYCNKCTIVSYLSHKMCLPSIKEEVWGIMHFPVLICSIHTSMLLGNFGVVVFSLWLRCS